MGQVLLLLVVALTVAAVVFGVTVLVTGSDEGLVPAEPDGRALPLPGNRPLLESDVGALRFDMTVRGYRMAQVDQALRRTAYDIGYKDELIGVLQAEVSALRAGRTTEAESLRRAREAALVPAGTVGEAGDAALPAITVTSATDSITAGAVAGHPTVLSKPRPGDPEIRSGWARSASQKPAADPTVAEAAVAGAAAASAAATSAAASKASAAEVAATEVAATEAAATEAAATEAAATEAAAGEAAAATEAAAVTEAASETGAPRAAETPADDGDLDPATPAGDDDRDPAGRAGDDGEPGAARGPAVPPERA